MSKLGSFKNVFKRKKSMDTNSIGSNSSLRNSTNSFENGNVIPYSVNEKSMSPFFKAVWRGELDKVKKLMKSNYNKIDKDKRSALHLAAAKGNLPIIKELVNNYNNEIMELTDNEKKTALFKAVERGILENVKWIFQKSSNKNPIDIYGNTLIHSCVMEKNVEMLSFLLEHGQLSCDVKNKGGLYPLHICAEKGFVVGIDTILKYTTQVDVYDDSSRTPLIKATIKGDIDCVRKLLAADSNVFLTDSEGHTALYYAEFYEYEKIANDIRHIERNSTKFRNIQKAKDEIDSVEPQITVVLPKTSNGSIHSDNDEYVQISPKKRNLDDSRDNSMDESDMDNSRVMPPKEFIEEVSTPNTSLPNPSINISETKTSLSRSGGDITQVSIKDNEDDNESIWNDSEDGFDQPKASARNDKDKQIEQVYTNPEIKIQKATPINTDDNSEWDSPESSEANPPPNHGRSLPNMTRIYDKVSPEHQPSISTISTTKYSINTEYELASGIAGGDVVGEEIVTKAPIQYDDSLDLLDDDEDEDDTLNDFNATVIPNVEFASSTTYAAPSHKKPPKSPHSLKEFSDDNNEMTYINGAKTQTYTKRKQPIGTSVMMADNLSYTSTEMDSKQNSVIENEPHVKDEHKSLQEYQNKYFRLQSQLRSMESDKEELLQKIELLNKEKSESDKQRTEIQKEKQRIEESLIDREQQLIEAKAKFSEAEKQLKKRENESEKLEQSKQNAEKQFQEAERNTILANSKIKQMQEEIETLHNEISELTDNRTELTEYRRTMEQMKQDHERSENTLKSKIRDLEEEKEHNSERMNRSLSEEKQENESLRRKLKNLEEDEESREAEVKQFKETIKKLNSDLESSNIQSTHSTRLETDLRDLRNESDELQKKIRELKRENADLQESLSKADKDRRKLNERIESNDDNQEIIEKYQSDLRRAESQIKDLEWTMGTRDKEINDSGEKIKLLEVEIDKLKDNNQNIIENLNKTIDTAIVHHADSPELLDVLQGIRKQAVQIKMGDTRLSNGHFDSMDLPENTSIELMKAKSRIKSLEEELEIKQDEYQRSMNEFRSTMNNHDVPDSYKIRGMVPVDEKKLRSFLANIDSQLRHVRDILRVEKQRVELLHNSQENNQRKFERQNKNLNYKNQECARLTDINSQLNQSVKQEKIKSIQNNEKEKALSNQLKLETKRSKNLRVILENIKEVLENFNKDLDYPVNLMADPTIVAATDSVDLENGFLNNLPTLSTRMLDYLKERNDTLQESLRKLERNSSPKKSGDHADSDAIAESATAAATLLNSQINHLTCSMESQRQNRERLDKMRDDSEYQLRNELYQLRHKSTLEVNELLDSNTVLEKDKHRLENEVRSLSDTLERERLTKDTLTEQLIHLVKQQPQSIPTNSVYGNSNNGSQLLLNGNSTLGASSPYSHTPLVPATNTVYITPHPKHAMSNSMFNISSGHSYASPNMTNLEDSELREHLKQQLDKSIARHLASGKPISQLNIKDKIRSLSNAKFAAS